MEEVLAGTHKAIEELKALGADVSQAELLLRDADQAFAAGNYERVREITENVRGSLDRAKGEVASRKVEVDLPSLVSAIRENRRHGLDVRAAQGLLTRLQDAMQKRHYRPREE